MGAVGILAGHASKRWFAVGNLFRCSSGYQIFCCSHGHRYGGVPRAFRRWNVGAFERHRFRPRVPKISCFDSRLFCFLLDRSFVSRGSYLGWIETTAFNGVVLTLQSTQQIVGRERSQLVSYDNLSVTWLTAAASTQPLCCLSHGRNHLAIDND